MTTAPFPVKPQIAIVNPDVEPSDEWIRAIARLLLADVDREFEETQQTEKPREGNARNRAGQNLKEHTHDTSNHRNRKDG